MIFHKDIERLLASTLAVLCAVFIAFRQIMHADALICIAILLLAIGLLYKRRNNFLYVSDSPIIFWLVCICWMFFSALHTYSILSGIKVSVVFATFVICGIALTNENGWYLVFIGTIKKLLCFHVMFTFFQVVEPKIAIKITGIFLDSESQILTREWMEQNCNYAGISGQTMVNAFYFILLGGISAVELLVKKSDCKKKVTNVLLLVLSCIALILTGKKGAWLAAIASLALVIIILWGTKKSYKKKLIKILIVIGLVAILIIIRLDVVTLDNALGSSVTSRERILYNAKLVFSKHPWCGAGTDSIAYYIGHSTHNIYIQVLCEYGIIGAILFIFTILYGQLLMINKVYKLSESGIEHESDMGALYLMIFIGSFILINGFTENTLFTYQFFLPYMLFLVAAYKPEVLKGKYNEEKTLY